MHTHVASSTRYAAAMPCAPIRPSHIPRSSRNRSVKPRMSATSSGVLGIVAAELSLSFVPNGFATTIMENTRPRSGSHWSDASLIACIS
jgi:hypothetical protein